MKKFNGILITGAIPVKEAIKRYSKRYKMKLSNVIFDERIVDECLLWAYF